MARVVASVFRRIERKLTDREPVFGVFGQGDKSHIASAASASLDSDWSWTHEHFKKVPKDKRIRSRRAVRAPTARPSGIRVTAPHRGAIVAHPG